jgi:hypothetical protein
MAEWDPARERSSRQQRALLAVCAKVRGLELPH